MMCKNKLIKNRNVDAKLPGKSKRLNLFVVALLLISLATVVGSCTFRSITGQADFFLEDDSLGKWLLSDKIDSFLTRQKESPEFENTGFSRSDYLDMIERQVRVFRECQDNSGRIIDPVKKEEKYYSTPCYAHSVAAWAASGYTKDKNLIESGMLAMDVVTEDMAKNWSAGGHGDFYTWPVMFAYDLFKGIANEERQARWKKNLAAMDPKKFYSAYQRATGNWNIVNTAGEFLRFKENLTTSNYVDTCLKYQYRNFTDYGMFTEGPMPYDLFPRHYICGMLASGYKGAYYHQYRLQSSKGAWMSMFLQSPFGELPTGHRSSHHIWNEAEQCVVFEIFASEYAKRGEKEKAGAFKRAAMLSLGNIKSWIRPDGSGYIVKNKYPIEDQYGYEGYSVHACYNMLAMSMLAQAWQFSNDRIKEKAAPADLGGYVVSIHKPLHKVIASAGQTYVEYDTRGDQIYNPTGILRIHIKGSHPQLGPSDGCASRYSGKDVSIATGPSWQISDGTWTSLAKWTGEPVIEILLESLKLTKFKLTYQVNDLSLSEIITVEEGKVTVEDELTGDVPLMRVTWPMLTFNGETYTNVQVNKNMAVLELEGKSIQFTAIEPVGVSLVRSGMQYGHRNGMVEPLYFEFKGNRAVYSISLASD